MKLDENNKSNACRICGNANGNRSHLAREMMFGTRDEFNYVECAACGTLQIAEVPDLAPYYPPDYYSFGTDEHFLGKSLRRRTSAYLTGKFYTTGRGVLGRVVAKGEKWLEYFFPKSLREPLLGLNFRSRILDFGCGSGALLQNLHCFGFRNLTGADAFIENDIFYSNGVTVYKRPLAAIEPGFDLVMLHHSFEHLPNPAETLKEIHAILSPGKVCLIRLPLASFAWEKYGVNWVQLDPPRHLYLFTERALRSLAEKSGFEVAKVVYDSEAFQFSGSEKYVRDISMFEERATNGDVEKIIFTAEQLREWQEEASRLNAEGRGDQACFYLRKA